MELVVAIQEIEVKVSWVAEIVLELFMIVIGAQVIDSEVFVGMIAEAVATQVSVASVVGM